MIHIIIIMGIQIRVILYIGTTLVCIEYNNNIYTDSIILYDIGNSMKIL